MVSGRTDERKDWREKDFSGSYHLTELYNERPVYKVSFILPATNCKIQIIILLFSGIKTLKVVPKFIFSIREVIDGIWQMVQIFEPKVQPAGCIWIHQVRNKISIHMQFISMFNIEQIIDTNEIF